jgi:CRISPR/Cas system-associated endoribonuclease Cas2
VPAYLVSYDLMKNKDYKRLTDELVRLDAHKALLSVWLLNLMDERASDVRDHLKRFVDEDDKLFVAEITKNAAGWMAFEGTAAWIKANA